jgi:hypothetical protein
MLCLSVCLEYDFEALESVPWLIVVFTFDVIGFSDEKFRSSSNFNVVSVFSEAVNLINCFIYLLSENIRD